MKFVQEGEGQQYEGKGHFNCWNMRKLSTEVDSQQLSISISHFLPHGGAEMSSSPKERVYFALSGSLLVKGKEEEYLLEPGDLIYIAPGEERAVEVTGTEPSTVLVIIGDVE